MISSVYFEALFIFFCVGLGFEGVGGLFLGEVLFFDFDLEGPGASTRSEGEEDDDDDEDDDDEVVVVRSRPLSFFKRAPQLLSGA